MATRLHWSYYFLAMALICLTVSLLMFIKRTKVFKRFVRVQHAKNVETERLEELDFTQNRYDVEIQHVKVNYIQRLQFQKDGKLGKTGPVKGVDEAKSRIPLEELWPQEKYDIFGAIVAIKETLKITKMSLEQQQQKLADSKFEYKGTSVKASIFKYSLFFGKLIKLNLQKNKLKADVTKYKADVEELSNRVEVLTNAIKIEKEKFKKFTNPANVQEAVTPTVSPTQDDDLPLQDVLANNVGRSQLLRDSVSQLTKLRDNKHNILTYNKQSDDVYALPAGQHNSKMTHHERHVSALKNNEKSVIAYAKIITNAARLRIHKLVLLNEKLDLKLLDLKNTMDSDAANMSGKLKDADGKLESHKLLVSEVQSIWDKKEDIMLKIRSETELINIKVY